MSLRDPVALLTEFYRRFTAGEREAMFDLLSPRIEWVNEPKGIHTYGHDELKALWNYQGNAAKVEIKPVTFTPTDKGVLVEVAEKVWIKGELVFAGPVGHDYTVMGELIRRCDIIDV